MSRTRKNKKRKTRKARKARTRKCAKMKEADKDKVIWTKKPSENKDEEESGGRKTT